MGTLGRTWQLYKQSFNVLSADTEVLLFPVLSAVSVILVGAGYFVPMYNAGSLAAMKNGTAGWDDYLALCLWYWANYFVIIFFNSALVACASIRLSGGDPTVGDGLRAAVGRLGRIAMWSLVAATVGMLLNSLRNRRGKLSSLLGSFLGVGWTLITYLIVPVLIFEDRSITDSIRRSADLFRKNWGEQVAGSFGFGLLNFLLFLPGLAIGAFVWQYDRVFAVIVGLLYVLILAAVSSAVNGIFTVALYRYATGGETPYGFTAESLGGGLRSGTWRRDRDNGWP